MGLIVSCWWRILGLRILGRIGLKSQWKIHQQDLDPSWIHQKSLSSPLIPGEPLWNPSAGPESFRDPSGVLHWPWDPSRIPQESLTGTSVFEGSLLNPSVGDDPFKHPSKKSLISLPILEGSLENPWPGLGSLKDPLKNPWRMKEHGITVAMATQRELRCRVSTSAVLTVGAPPPLTARDQSETS